MTRISGEHHFEYPRMPHVLAHQLVDIAHAKGPMAHPYRQAVDGNFNHEIARYQIEIDRIEVEAKVHGQRFNAAYVVCQGGVAVSHGANSADSASCTKNLRKARHTSSVLASTLFPI